VQKDEAIKFLQQAVREGDTLTFLIHDYLLHPRAFRMKIYNNLIEIGPAMAAAMGGMRINEGDDMPLTIQEEQDSIIYSMSDPRTLRDLLEEILNMDMKLMYRMEFIH
jgi:hypothetical protein